MKKTLLIFGYGYSSSALARVLLAEGWRIIATTRRHDKAAKMAEEGVEPRVWPGSDLSDDLNAASHVLVSAGPDADGDPVLRSLDAEFQSSDFEWVGYLSTTGVYGDHQGAWVDEDTALTPSTERGQMRVDAERHWQSVSAKAGWPLHIFRLAGIYGPGRGPFAKVRKGTARRIVKKDQVFSRIHVDDIAQVLEASINKGGAGRVYNVCDDVPAPPQDVIAHAAETLGVDLPPEVAFETADMTPMARSFYAESKRVRNDRMKRELGVALKYPDYQTGLAALLEEERRS